MFILQLFYKDTLLFRITAHFIHILMKNQQTDDRKKFIDDESKLLEDHRKENKEILTRHFYDMSKYDVKKWRSLVVEWLGKGFALEFLLCFLYTVISIAYFVASYIDK